MSDTASGIVLPVGTYDETILAHAMASLTIAHDPRAAVVSMLGSWQPIVSQLRAGATAAASTRSPVLAALSLQLSLDKAIDSVNQTHPKAHLVRAWLLALAMAEADRFAARHSVVA